MYLIWALSIKGKNNWLVLLGRITMLNPRNNMLLLSYLGYIALRNNYRCQNCSNLFTETTVDPWSEKQPPLPNQTSIQCTHTGYPFPPPWSYKTQKEACFFTSKCTKIRNYSWDSPLDFALFSRSLIRSLSTELDCSHSLSAIVESTPPCLQ